MCNDYGNRVPYSDYLPAFREIRIPVRWPADAPNLEPRDDIWPTFRATSANTSRTVPPRWDLRCAGRVLRLTSFIFHRRWEHDSPVEGS